MGNMDVFCFANPQWPLEGDEDLMPVGLKQPRRLLEGVHQVLKMEGIPRGFQQSMVRFLIKIMQENPWSLLEPWVMPIFLMNKNIR